MTNDHMQIWEKRGTSLYGPVPDNAPWVGFGGACEIYNDGDPIANYDPIADRWVLSQFAVPQFSGGAGGFHECFAVSATPDPTGAYHRYDFSFGNNLFNDYPHIGVWPDAYYASFNIFDCGINPNCPYAGSAAVAYDRAQMLAGQPATGQMFRLTAASAPMLPSDLDGPTLPPTGAPNTYVEMNLDTQTLNFRNFHVDWANPAHSTFSSPTILPVDPFNATCAARPDLNCVSQPGTTVGVDALDDRLMFRVAYRNFGDHQAIVLNHSVDVGATDSPHYAVRWYEVRDPANHPVIYQQGTYAPDGTSRWMGSIAQDHQGNMALGYSVSSSVDVFPGIRYTGRLVTDTLGSMPQGEATIISGGGSQLGEVGAGQGGRWGDYSNLVVDPRDDCTFWYTNEYIPITTTLGWHTRIGAFKFPGCTNAPPATATAPPSATPCSITFTDVHPSDYFYTPVQYLACRGIISGYSDNTYRPNNPTTRGQMVKIVVNAYHVPGYSPPNQYTFTDVTPAYPFFTFIEAAAHAGIVSGYTCGGPGEPCDSQHRPYVRPNADVTRGQLSKIVVVAAGWGLINPPTATFTDVPRNSPFYTFIETAACHGIISGYADHTFRPNNSATRGQIAKIVYGALTSTTNCAIAVVTATPHPITTPPTATATPNALCAVTTITGSITMADTTQVGRLGRDDFASTCALVKTCPGVTADTNPRHYDAYQFRNDTGAPACVTVRLDTQCNFENNTSIFSAAYLGSYDPTNPCTNYLADMGYSPPALNAYQFTVPAGATYVVVVNEVNPNTGCGSYTLSVSCGTRLP
jgi:hypothetical protein